jgi:UDP-3-O-[3-hydroxymyristoyl] glucosamine N-acyltransferase
VRASIIADLVEGRLEGGGDPDITGVAPLDRAGPRDLAFLAQARYLSYLAGARPGALLVAAKLAEQAIVDCPRIVVRDVHRALALLLPELYPEAAVEAGIHPTAVIGPGAELGAGVRIDAYAVVGAGSRIGGRSRLGAHVVVGDGCVVGEDVIVHPHVTLYPGVQVGDRSILHGGVRLGVDGFGYVHERGGHRKVPQVGGCVIGRDVEIGANTTVDRGSIGVTEIGDGVKIDNLVHIGHNVRIGEHTIIIAQVGVSGSATIGRGVTLAGQAGVNGHIRIGDGATIAGPGGVFSNVPAGAVYSGYPARPHKEALRAQAVLFRLPELIKRLRAVERLLPAKEVSDE